MWTLFKTKAALNKQIEELTAELSETKKLLEAVKADNHAITNKFYNVKKQFPLNLGATVYVLELKNERGRYVKNKPSLEHSNIQEVVVDEKNYFRLVNRYRVNRLFSTIEEAEHELDVLCGV